MKTPTNSAKNKCLVASESLLADITPGALAVAFLSEQVIFAQGDKEGAVFYIQEGAVRLTVTSRFGKQATLSVLSAGAFFGDGGLAGQSLRMKSATAMTDCKLFQIDNQAMMEALHSKSSLSDLFVRHLVARNIRYHRALVEQLFDPSDKRLARVLLLHAHFGEKGAPEMVVAKISQRDLAKMADISPHHVGSLMKDFRKAGFVTNGKSGLQIHASLVSVVLRS